MLIGVPTGPTTPGDTIANPMFRTLVGASFDSRLWTAELYRRSVADFPNVADPSGLGGQHPYRLDAANPNAVGIALT